MIKNLKYFIETSVWGIFAEPSKVFSILLKLLPFVIFISSYVAYSNYQTSIDKRQKVYPTIEKLAKKTEKNLLSPNKRINPEAYKEWKPINKKIKALEKEIKKAEESGLSTSDMKAERWSLKLDAYQLGLPNSIMWNDTKSSLYRLLSAMLIAASFSLIVALYMGMYKLVDYTFNDFTTVYSLIQPVAILPIIMIIFGVEDYGKIIFIILGVVPPILLSTYLSVKAVPKQTIIKGKTLGASDFQVMRTVVLPQVMPHFINTIRLTLFLGWMLLLTSEMISAESGLGYRIMLEKRFTNMDTIIPYVLWIMFMSYLTDKSLKLLIQKLCPWFATK